MRVLIIEDDAALRSVVRAVLEDFGHEVCEASNGAEGLDCLARELPDLILLDLRMPRMNGQEFCERLGPLGLARVPIALMTADRSAHQWADTIGTAHWLPKPFAIEELLAVIERVDASSAERHAAAVH